MLIASIFRIFDSPIFTIVVGPQRKIYTAHRAVLLQCRFFKAACGGPFKEAITRRLVFREDDPGLFHHVLEHLYYGDYGSKLRGSGAKATINNHPVDAQIRMTECREHARIYCLADKYSMIGLRKLAIKKLRLLAPLPAESLLDIAKDVYPSLGPYDSDLRTFVREQIFNFPVDDETWDLCNILNEDWLVQRIQQGGTVAVDILKALRSICRDTKDGVISQGQQLQLHDRDGNDLLEDDRAMDRVEDGGPLALDTFTALRAFYSHVKGMSRQLGSSVRYEYDGESDVEGRRITTIVQQGANPREALFE